MKIGFDTAYQTQSPASGISATGEIPGQIPGQNRQFTVNAAERAAAGGLLYSHGMNDIPMAEPGQTPMTDLAAGLGATDVQLKTDFMSVMSLSMSDEDYREMVRTGQMPEEMDAADSVTILDNIKAAVIKGGTQVAGYTDTLDRDTLAQVAGSESAAAALMKKTEELGLVPDTLSRTLKEQDLSVNPETIMRVTDAVALASEALPISDEAAAYLVNNGKSPTVENIYQASNAGAADALGGRRYFSEGGYVSRQAGASEEDIEALRPQIEDTIRRAGLEVNEETLADAKLLIGHSIPLSPETLLELDNIRELRSESDPNRLAGAVSIALSAGIPAHKANLTYERSVFLQAEEIADTVASIPEEAVDAVVSEGKLLNIRNLRMAYTGTEAPSTRDNVTAPGAGIISGDMSSVLTETSGINAEAGADLGAEQLRARRVLEEVRLTMSVEANRLLLRGNFRIDTAPLEDLVKALKEAEDAAARRLFPSEEEGVSGTRLKLYTQTQSELERIPSMPAAILGQYGVHGRLQFGVTETFTLHEVYESGSARRDAYIRAEETYEALMTAPRRDMGDSIRKAFRNVDDILDDLKLEVNELNRRAVRILGYNSTEITPERIEQVREADVNLRSVIDRLTPERVLNMIREDVNPLNMPISELSEYLDGQDSDPERQASDYARFLMQLERQGEINDLERKSYIGIYRMLSRLDKTEDAAVGRLLATGAEMSFANLLSAMRSAVKGGMDYSVGDDFGGVDSLRSDIAIDEQINAAFTTGRFAESARVSESIIENLLMSGQNVSPDTVEAMNALKGKRGDWFRPIVMRSAGTDGERGSLPETDDVTYGADERENIIDVSDDVLGHMTGCEEAYEAYTSMLEGAKSQVSSMIFEAGSYVDVRSLQSSLKQMNILTSLARNEVYDLPADIDGEMTSIRLTIRHESGAGRVAVSMMTVTLGTVAAEFTLRGGASGYIMCESDEAVSRISALADEFEKTLGFRPDPVRAGRVNPEKYTDSFFDHVNEKDKNEIKDEDTSSDINNIELYNVARKFITALKKI